ncbi:MAG: hypothetical protein MAG795_01261 [Candidatus Woesearchaeota archaeon]|nr:hypothetical protein [Candidatus Woesearchaeota archaeon]
MLVMVTGDTCPLNFTMSYSERFKYKLASEFITMKKILAIILMILLIGCTKEPDTQPEPAEQVEVETQVVEPEEPEVEPLDEDIKELFARNSKIKSYEYMYRGVSPIIINYYVRGENIKISHPQLQKYDGFEFYDVYLGSKEAYLVCDKVDECKGRKSKIVGLSNFAPTTPMQIVSQIDNGEITETTQIENRDTSVISYTNQDGNSERVWIWDYWGLPVKREIITDDGKIVIEYDNLVVNSVKEDQVTLPEDLDLQ